MADDQKSKRGFFRRNWSLLIPAIVIGLNPRFSPVPGWLLRGISPLRHAASAWAYHQDPLFDELNIRKNPGFNFTDTVKEDIRHEVTTPAQQAIQTEADQAGLVIEHAVEQAAKQHDLVMYVDDDRNKPHTLTDKVKVGLARAVFNYVSKLADLTRDAAKKTLLIPIESDLSDRCTENNWGKVKSGLSAASASTQELQNIDADELMTGETIYLQCESRKGSQRVNNYDIYESAGFKANVEGYARYAQDVAKASQLFVTETAALTGVKALPYVSEEDKEAADDALVAAADRDVQGTPAAKARKDISDGEWKLRQLGDALLKTDDGPRLKVDSWKGIPLDKRPAAEAYVSAVNRAASRLLIAGLQIQGEIKSYLAPCKFEAEPPKHVFTYDADRSVDQNRGDRVHYDIENADDRFLNADIFSGCTAGYFANEAARNPAVYRDPHFVQDAQTLDAYIGKIRKINQQLANELP